MIVNIGHKKCNVDFSLTSEVDAEVNRRFVTTCMIIDESHRPFAGVAIKAPNDRHFTLVGQKTALRRAFEQIYKATPSLATQDFSLLYEKVRVDILGAEPE